MRLISLASDIPTFKKIIFNKTGPSFILARQEKPQQSDNTRTYNGVGKSLLISLIDFCLGAKTESKIAKSLHSKIPKRSFTLEVQVDNQTYTIVRHTNYPDEISLNGEKLELKDFCFRLEALCFEIPTGFQYLTFRSLLPFFLRPSKKSYIYYDEPTKVGTPYQKQLYNAFLLGLDVNVSEKKMKLKKEIDETESAHKNIKNDPILKQFFEGYRDSSLALADLNEKIEKLEIDLEKFEVADDYYQIKEEADGIKNNLDKIQNNIKLRKINLESINKSLKITPDISRSDVQKIYDESKFVFQKDIDKRLIDLEKFYQDLTVNRTKKLLMHKNEIVNEINSLEGQFTNLKEQLDENLKFLNAHHALDVFIELNSQLEEFKQSKKKLQEYEGLQHKYEQKKIYLKKEMIVQSEKTAAYLEEVKNDINKIMEYFRALVKRFYPNALAGITVNNNDGKNKTRYDIEAKIQSDSSDGINSVKLFCYDLTILIQGSNHSLNFIFHDSRLFSDIDETHCNELFRIVKDRFSDQQYIASINQNQLNDLSVDVQNFVKDNIIQELTDDSDDGKLLGITVELEYD